MHVEANIKIYFTRDYSRFKNIQGNRTLNERKIDKIINDIEDGFDMLRYCPIIVDKDMNVIDGQHRLQVARDLGSNIWYVISDTISLHEIAKMNTNTERWKPKDFIHCYCENGIQSYYDLKEYMKAYKIPLMASIDLLMNGNIATGGKKSTVEKFETGKFVVNYKQQAEEIGLLIQRFDKYPGYLSRNFIAAIQRVLASNKCQMDKLITKFEKIIQHLKNAPQLRIT